MFQEINYIEFKLNYVDSSTSFILDGITFNNIYYIDVFIDDENIRTSNKEFYDLIVVFSELEKSIHKSDKYLIFTSACGVADDGGWEGVSVEIKNDTIEWYFPHGEKNYIYRFSKTDLITKIEKLKAEINNEILKKLEPKYIDFPEEW